MFFDEYNLFKLGSIHFYQNVRGSIKYNSKYNSEEIYECYECGSLVISKKQHAIWHEKIENYND